MPLQAQRRRAWLALFTVFAALIALVVPLVVIAVAQQAPVITLLNPSSYKPCPDAAGPCFVISDKKTSNNADEEDGENETTYRLNAWSANTPADAIVEFELDIAQDLELPTTITIGTAERVENGTWEYNWDVDVPDGQYTLRAILYQGGLVTPEEVARTERVVTVLSGNPEASTARPAADIVNPVNGEPIGFYLNPLTGATNTLVDVEWSQGTVYLQINYTLSDPGDEPVWKQCSLTRLSTSDAAPAGQGRFRCLLANVDQGGQSVTAINAVANDTPTAQGSTARFDPNFNQGGDSIRVLPYLQDASAVSIDNPQVRANSNPDPEDIPGTQDDEGDPWTGICSPGQIIVVEDQFGRPIGDISIDVHAFGPTDRLKFQAIGLLSDEPPSDYGAPDKAHGGVESTYVCNDITFNQSFAGSQAEHSRPGAPDVKHVEGTTGSAGSFGIGMHTDRAGDTFVTFWVDEDDDDLFCSQEPSIGATIGWDQPAAPPQAETPAKTDCPIPTPPPPGGTESPTGTPTDPPTDCTVEGDDGDNELEGTEGDDVICGNGGDDTIRGFGGDDIIRGGEGDDTADGGDGNDTINGEEGNDRLTGDAGDDALDGGDGVDLLRGSLGNDTLIGVRGSDGLRGDAGRDIIQGGHANDFGLGGGGDDVLRGYNGKDVLRGGGASDVIRGGRGADNLIGNKGADTLAGGPQRDRCRGGSGPDRQRSCER